MTVRSSLPVRRVIRGDSDSFTITFNSVYKNSMGIKVKTPIDITGWDVRFTVRKDIPSTTVISDDDAIIHKVAQVPSGTDGVAVIPITNEDTNIDAGEYWYDVQYVVHQGTPDEVTKSISKGRYVIVSDITRDAG